MLTVDTRLLGSERGSCVGYHSLSGAQTSFLLWGTLGLIATSSVPSSLGLQPAFLPPLLQSCQRRGRGPLQLALAGNSNTSCTISHHGLCAPCSDCRASSLDPIALLPVSTSVSQRPGNPWIIAFMQKFCLFNL